MAWEPRKRCNVCKELKPLSDFYRAAGMRDGHRNDCKRCNLSAKHERYVANPEPTKERVRQWQRVNADRHQATQRRIRQSPEGRRRSREGYLRRKYGITQADYDARLAKQNGGCAICGRAPAAKGSLHVDHDHESGRVRGLLCFRGNNALGDFGDGVGQLRRAIEYLQPLTDEDQRLIALARQRLQRELLRKQ